MYHRSWPGAHWGEKTTQAWAREPNVARDFPCPCVSKKWRMRGWKWGVYPKKSMSYFSCVTQTLCSHRHVIPSLLILSRRSCIPSSEGVLKTSGLVQPSFTAIPGSLPSCSSCSATLARHGVENELKFFWAGKGDFSGWCLQQSLPYCFLSEKDLSMRLWYCCEHFWGR